MERRIWLFLVAGLAFASHLAPTRACSTTAGYLMPSNFELVRDTQAIVLAKATRLAKKDDEASQVEFDVVQVLKGQVDVKTLTLFGHLQWCGESDPLDFSTARPGARSANT